eukprot:Pompholyxophrys_sp_v1_NODE_4_length_15125_cov_6.573656.p10 type:complete len:145 gc:universal NODE_4_length_15125_cov_6.573656:1974-2408(+)
MNALFLLNQNRCAFRTLPWKFESPMSLPNLKNSSNYRIVFINMNAFLQFKHVTITFDFIVLNIASNTDAIKLKLPIPASHFFQNTLITKEFPSYTHALNNNGAIVMGTVSVKNCYIIFDAYQFNGLGNGRVYRLTGQIVYMTNL